MAPIEEQQLIESSRILADSVDRLSFQPPVSHVYNPLQYAQAPHEEYIRRYGGGPKKAVFLGMNPGPWGMTQTGVPFGEIAHVRTWLRICGDVGKPPREHPKRPVLGFSCEKSEVSGRRLWTLFEERYGEPGSFFADFYVANYCPLVFLEESGRNRTPDKLPAAERTELFDACDAHLLDLMRILRPRWIIGIGKFAESRAAAVVERTSTGSASAHPRPSVTGILHPSPANPRANSGWATETVRRLVDEGIWSG